ncbi:hypothetical protein CDD82_6870 [Ophiocordyceps australis]|uniref:Uncharacterized protein n=1 Tax=Ophiocordyceps australis TaxID=1399860 RepID=A0A2C5XFV4_9HYPO|nr:hypothetical protein CDD82_6870 [Ophiocordyceps australis]
MHIIKTIALAAAIAPTASLAQCYRDGLTCKWWTSNGNRFRCGKPKADFNGTRRFVKEGDVVQVGNETRNYVVMSSTKDRSWSVLCKNPKYEHYPGPQCCHDYDVGCWTGWRILLCWDE